MGQAHNPLNAPLQGMMVKVCPMGHGLPQIVNVVYVLEATRHRAINK